MATITPYLNFPGNCEEAFQFYKSAFGGEYAMLMRFKDAPSNEQRPGEENLIMHVSLPIGKGTILMGSDRPASMGTGTKGDNFSISINADSEEEAKKIFDALSAGGNITMPLDKTFWGAYFGMFVDKFGIAWMVNYDYNQQ